MEGMNLGGAKKKKMRCLELLVQMWPFPVYFCLEIVVGGEGWAAGLE